jgi:hypothetical protein
MLLVPCSLSSQEPAWPLAGGIPLHSGFVLLLLASGFPLPCPQLPLRRVSLTSKFLVFRLCSALLVLIPMVWMSLHLLWGAANINIMVIPMGGLHVIMGGLASSITPSAFLLLVQRPITGVHNFPGGIPLVVPSFIHGPSPPRPLHGESPHASASVASMLASTAHPLRPLVHEDNTGSSALDLMMSFWLSLSAAAVPPVVPSAVVPPAAPVLLPVPMPVPPVINVDSVGDSTIPVPAPVLIICLAEPFKLPPIADAKVYLNLSSIIQYYLYRPEFLTQCSDDALVTDSRNAEVNAYWEGQIRVAIQDGSLHFLFENKGLMFDGKGFEMLAVLKSALPPQLSCKCFHYPCVLFNDSMGESEEIMAFRSRLDRVVNNMSCCKIILPLVLISCSSFVPFTLVTTTSLSNFVLATNPLKVHPLIPL